MTRKMNRQASGIGTPQDPEGRGRRSRARRSAAAHRRADDLGAEQQEHRAAPVRHRRVGLQRDRREGQGRPRLHPPDDGARFRRGRAARGHAAQLLRHRRHRVLDGQEGLPGQARCRRWTSRRSSYFDKIVPIFTTGKLKPDSVDRPGHRAAQRSASSRARTRPSSPRADPVVHHDPDDLQRRHARHPPRPGRPRRSRSWKDILDPKFKGKTVDPQHPVDRHHGRGDDLRSRPASSNTPTRAT